jgi:hypothetical protein
MSKGNPRGDGMSEKGVAIPAPAADQNGKIAKPDEGPNESLVQRVNQVYRAYLNAIYELEYYRADQERTMTWSRRWDFIIGLSAAISGGSGIGVLADPRLAWLCGVIATGSVILTVGKSVYDWPGRLKVDTERINDYSRLRYDYQYLKDDVESNRVWSNQLENRFLELRKREQLPETPYKRLNIKIRRAIQNGVKARYDYKRWWLWQ